MAEQPFTEWYATSSNKTTKTEYKLSASTGGSITFTVETEIATAQKWWWYAQGADIWGWVVVGTDIDVTTTKKVNGVAAREDFVHSRHWWSRFGEDGDGYSSSTILDADANAMLSGISCARSSNNTVAMIAGGKIFGVVSPNGAKTDLTPEEKVMGTRPWASWNPVTNEIAVGNGKCWV